MNKVQSSKLNCLLSVSTLLTSSANQSRVASLPALEDATEELAELILAINLNVKVQSSSSGATEAKKDALESLGDLAYEVAGGVHSFAEKSNDLNLAARVNFSVSAITAGSANAVVARCQNIIDAATESLASLADHGITSAKVNGLKQRLKTYDGLRNMPRQAIAAAAAATKQLETLFPEADRLLKNRIDKLVWQFRESAPDFYQQYQVARTIVDAPTSGTQNTAVPTPIPAPAPASKAA